MFKYASHSKLSASSSMSEFMICDVKAFMSKLILLRQICKEVTWQPRLFNWIKCNCDGASAGNIASFRGIFRNNKVLFLGCLAEGLGPGNSYYVDLCGAMQSIEFANSNNWRNLWLESDSMLVVKAFKDVRKVPWMIRNRWTNSLAIVSSIYELCFTCIYRR